MITNQDLISQCKSANKQDPASIQRRTLMSAGLLALLSSPRRAIAEEDEGGPGNPFILLLKGLYQLVPAGHGPNLGLSSVNLSDGTYSKTKIYPVFKAPGGTNGENSDDGAIGTFYVSLVTGLCAYDLPGGAIAMQFIAGGNFPVVVPDGRGGQYDEGTIPLKILEATGIYRAFAGGHNNMVDKLHQLVAGAPFAAFPSSGYDEFCFCIVSQYQFP